MLRYFPPDPKFKVTRYCTSTSNPERVPDDHEQGNEQQFHRLGYFEFEIEEDGKASSLQVRGAGKQRAFHSLQGRTSGKESYAAARYLDIEEKPGNDYMIDFNYAYNPILRVQRRLCLSSSPKGKLARSKDTCGRDELPRLTQWQTWLLLAGHDDFLRLLLSLLSGCYLTVLAIARICSRLRLVLVHLMCMLV